MTTTVRFECFECEFPVHADEIVWVLLEDRRDGLHQATATRTFVEVPAGTDGAIAFHRECLVLRIKRNARDGRS